MSGTNMRSKLTVWYNTKCPVCNGGIEWQNNRLVRAARAGAIEFRDINLEPEILSRFGAGVEGERRARALARQYPRQRRLVDDRHRRE